MADFALELSLAPDDAAAVVAQWEAIRTAGLPSQADHRSMTNAPHVTLVAAAAIGDQVRADAQRAFRGLLPSPLVVRGLLLLGEGPRVTVAHLVEPTAEVATATGRLRARAAVRHPVWTPHVTLARRVPRADLPRLLDALAQAPQPRALEATRLRWWDPGQGVIEELVGP